MALDGWKKSTANHSSLPQQGSDDIDDFASSSAAASK
jgi:hypothetical protein